MALIDDLRAVRALLASPATRVRGHSAVDAQGRRVKVNDPAAVAWDLNGAIHKVCLSPERRDAVLAALEGEIADRALGPDGLPRTDVKAFDQADRRTEAAVLQSLDRVISARGGTQIRGR